MIFRDKINSTISESDLISRDLSWMEFNDRVLDLAENPERGLFEKLKFAAITSSNLDEFFMIRVGSLYNYLDYNKPRTDFSGLNEQYFRIKLLEDVQDFVARQQRVFSQVLAPAFKHHNFQILPVDGLSAAERADVDDYFHRTLFPMLTPMVDDQYHTFPTLAGKALMFCVVTLDHLGEDKHDHKYSFVQVPQNLPRFFEVKRDNELVFVPIEEIIRSHIHILFRNVEITEIRLMRITRNGDFTLEESEDLDRDFIEEIKQSLKSRRTGRVVRLEIEQGYSKSLIQKLNDALDIDHYNIFAFNTLIDLTSLWQIITHHAFSVYQPASQSPVVPISLRGVEESSIFQKFKGRDVLLHHPFNSIDPLLELLETSANDPDVLAIKMTIYRLAKNSRISKALHKAVENGKHVAVLFELKARFDEENNIREAERLQDAGAFVAHGVGNLKTHTKMLLIVRKESDQVTRYVHMSTGNYNESTSRFYTDLSMITTKEAYANDVSEFFNAITGHSRPSSYRMILTAPNNMRDRLMEQVRLEAENARNGKTAGIVIKVNSLQDDRFIRSLYEASQAGVPIKLIVRGICCLRPGRQGLSENIEVRSLVGDFLEHSRLFYFHNDGDPLIYSGSADAMVRSFDRRIESVYLISDSLCKQEAMNILCYNIKDNVNAYIMNEDGFYSKVSQEGKELFDSHKAFYEVTKEEIEQIVLFREMIVEAS